MPTGSHSVSKAEITIATNTGMIVIFKGVRPEYVGKLIDVLGGNLIEG